MDAIDLEIRFEADDTRQSPGRLTGVLLTYEALARDRAEVFTRGSLYWPENGIVINQQHDRKAPIVRAIPFLGGDEVRVDVALPNTTAGRDAAENVREGVLTGLSVEFKAEQEGRRGGLREIRRARLGAAGLVDSPSYRGSLVEVRAKLADSPRKVFLWL